MEPETQQPGSEDAGQNPSVPPPQSALHRKAQAGRAEHSARAVSLAKALRLSVAKVADEQLDMAMAVLAARITHQDGDALDDLLADDRLLMLLDGPLGARGAAVFDAQVVAALIQQQTMGKVIAPTGDAERSLTATDAAICAPFLDAVLQGAALLPDAPQDRQVIQGFAFGSHADDPRLITIALTAHEYHVTTLTLDIASGTRQGEVVLLTPVIEEVESDPVPDAAPGPDGFVFTGPPQQRTLEGAVLGLEVDLNIALTRVSMPLRQLSGLNVGDCIDLGQPEFENARVLTAYGRTIAQGMLGQVNGQRALQLSEAANVGQAHLSGGDGAELEITPHGKAREEPDMMLSDTGIEDDALLDPAALADLPHDDLDLPDMSDLPDLPDMSDLPELDAPA